MLITRTIAEVIIPEPTADKNKETQAVVNDCCIWKSCNECNTMQKEQEVIKSKHKDEVKAIQFRLDASLKDLISCQEQKALIESENEEHIKTLEAAIDERDGKIENMKADHLKELNELKSIDSENGDLNLKRLKRMYADLKKEKNKVEENYKKDIDSLKKQKTDLEGELSTTSKDNKNKEDERNTLVKIFEGMNEMFARLDISTTSNPGTGQTFSCDSCAFKSNDSIDFNLHNANTKHTCEVCSEEFSIKTTLEEHR